MLFPSIDVEGNVDYEAGGDVAILTTYKTVREDIKAMRDAVTLEGISEDLIS